MPDSTILVKGEGWKVKAAVGLGGIIAIIALAFMYRFQVGVAVLIIGLGVGARVGVWAWHQYKLAGFEQRRLFAEVLRLEYEADKARIERHFLEFNAGVFHIEHPDEAVGVRQFYPAVQASKWLADAPALLPETAPRLRRLLDVDFIHMLIVGATNTGKTTVANWLIENEAPDSAIYVLDPHNKFNIWPARVSEVIGTGRNYAMIDAKLVELIGEMDRRYNSDVLRFSKILIVCDEWLSVLENCPSAGRFFDTIGSEARKVNMSLIISTTSATADDLNCTAATRDNLVQLGLNRTLKDKNQGELIWSRKDKELVELPGPYRVAFALRQAQDATPARAVTEPMPIQEAVEPEPVDTTPIPLTPTGDELRICELWDKGSSLRAIWKEVYGTEFGGRQAEEIKKVLRRFGRVE